MTQFLSPDAVADFGGVILDCRFDLKDPEAGRRAYGEGHIPGAHYVHLNEDLSAPVAAHGGRHPLPSPEVFAAALARLGIARDTPVLLYDDSSYAYGARCWWMLRALGFGPVYFLAGGYARWLAAGGQASLDEPVSEAVAVEAVPDRWPGCVDRSELMAHQGQGARVVDAREAARYRGEVEPIDPVAGHIPGAENRPWQAFIGADGLFLDTQALRDLWGDLAEGEPPIAYCGSGVTACVALLSLALVGRDDALLYSGSWSDWCSYL